MRVFIAEQRREVRRPGQGAVRVQWNASKPMEVAGRLLDVSDSGFRMAHRCATLRPGQVVDFAHFEAKGTARAMWTRIVDQGSSAESVETGFFVVELGQVPA